MAFKRWSFSNTSIPSTSLRQRSTSHSSMPCVARGSFIVRQRRRQHTFNGFTKGYGKHSKKVVRKKVTRSRRADDGRVTSGPEVEAVVPDASCFPPPFPHEAPSLNVPPMPYFNPYGPAYAPHPPFDQSCNLNPTPSFVPSIHTPPFPYVYPSSMPGDQRDYRVQHPSTPFPFTFEHPYQAPAPNYPSAQPTVAEPHPGARIPTPALSIMDDTSNMSTTPTFRSFTCEPGPSTCQAGPPLREPGPSNQVPATREDKGKGRAVDSDAGSLTPRPISNDTAIGLQGHRIVAVRFAARGLYQALDCFMSSLNDM